MLSRKTKIKKKVVASICTASMVLGFFAPGVVHHRNTKADTYTGDPQFNNPELISIDQWWPTSGVIKNTSNGTITFDSTELGKVGVREGNAAVLLPLEDPQLLKAINTCSVPYTALYSARYTDGLQGDITLKLDISFNENEDDAMDMLPTYSITKKTSSEDPLDAKTGMRTISIGSDDFIIPTGAKFAFIQLTVTLPEDETSQLTVYGFLDVIQDSEDPTIQADYSDAWTNSPDGVYVKITADDNIGVAAIYNSVNDQKVSDNGTYDFYVKAEGTNNYSFYAVDFAGKKSDAVEFTVDNYDIKAPIDFEVKSAPTTWVTDDIGPVIELPALANAKGTSPETYVVKQGDTYVPFDGTTYTVTSVGTTKVIFAARDAAGNQSADTEVTVYYDPNEPTFTYQTVPNAAGKNDITVNAVDGDNESGIQKVLVISGKDKVASDFITNGVINDGVLDITTSGSFVAETKDYTVYVEDNAGNVTIKNIAAAFKPVITDVEDQSFTEDQPNDGNGNNTEIVIPVVISDIDTDLYNLDLKVETNMPEVFSSLEIKNTSTGADIIAVLAPDKFTTDSDNPTITITADDGENEPVTSTFGFSIIPDNDAPVATSFGVQTQEDTDITIDLAKDGENRISDIDNDLSELSVSSYSSSIVGGVLTNNGLTFTFKPNSGWYGETSFTYIITDGDKFSEEKTVTITVTNDPSAPTADDIIINIDEDNDNKGDVEIDALASCSDADIIGSADDDILSIVAINGTAIVEGGSVDTTYGKITLKEGKLYFTVTPDAYGAETITYTVSDNTTDENGVPRTATAKILMTIDPVNDGPEVTGIPASVDVAENSSITDSDNSFTFSVNDIDNSNSEIMIIVSSKDETIIRSKDIVVNRDGDNVTVSFAPIAGVYNKSVVLTVKVSDGGETVTKDVTVNVTNVHDAPEAKADDMTIDWKIDENKTAIFDTAALLKNDKDLDGDELKVVAVKNVPEGLTITVDADTQKISILSDAQVYGKFTFTYVVSDGDDATDNAEAQVTIDIKEVKDPPVITLDSSNVYACDENTGKGEATYIEFKFTVTDPDTNLKDIMESVTNDNPTLIRKVDIQPDDANSGVYIVKIYPEVHEAGTANITIKASDGDNNVLTPSIPITVNNVPDLPVAVDDEYTITAGMTTYIMPVENDYDYDKGEYPTLLDFTQPIDKATGKAIEGSSVTYDSQLEAIKIYAPVSYEGDLTFTYRISDKSFPNDPVTGNVLVHVSPIKVSLIKIDAPEYIAVKNSSKDNTFDFYANSYSSAKIVSDEVVAIADDGSKIDNIRVTVNDDGSFTCTYDAVDDATGEAFITLMVKDTNGNVEVAKVKLFIKEKNYAPVAGDVDFTKIPKNGTEGDSYSISISSLIKDYCTDEDGDTIKLSNVAIKSGGNSSSYVYINGDSIIYNPYDGDFYGNVVLEYTVTDGFVESNTATIKFRLDNTPEPPVARTNRYEVENLPGKTAKFTAANLLNNDYDNDNGYDGHTETLYFGGFATLPKYGTVEWNETEKAYVYTRTSESPATHGADSFTYYLYDVDPEIYDPSNENHHRVTGTILIEEIYEYLYGNEGIWRTIKEVCDPTNTTGTTVTATCSRPSYASPDNIAFEIVSESNPTLGTVSIVGRPTKTNSTELTNNSVYVKFVPNLHQPLPDKTKNTDNVVIRFTVTDGYKEDGTPITRSVTQTIVFTVIPVNDAPEFIDSSCDVIIPIDNEFNITSDIQNHTWTCDEHGTMTFDLYYEDIDNEESELSFGVTVTNDDEDKPVAQKSDVVFTRVEDGHVQATVTFLENVYGGVSFEFFVFDGIVKDYITFDGEVIEVDDPPVALDVTGTIKEDTNYEFYLTNYYSDIDTLMSDLRVDFDDNPNGKPTHGTVTIDSDGLLKYTPDPDWYGTEVFTYRVYTDGRRDTAYDTATITVTVTPVNDEPFLYNVPPVIVMEEDHEGGYEFTFDAYDIEGFIPDGATEPVPGAVRVEVESSNSDIFEQGNEDTIKITAPAHPEDGETQYKVSLHPKKNSSGDVTLTIYVWDGDYEKNEDGTFKLDDNGNKIKTEKKQTITVTVSEVNDLPEAKDDGPEISDKYVIEEVTTSTVGVSYIFDVIANEDITDEDTNDTDVETDTKDLKIIAVTKPTHGTAVVTNGQIKYTPDANFNSYMNYVDGVDTTIVYDTFVYTIKDKDGATDDAIVKVKVKPVNSVPEVEDDEITVTERASASIDLLGLVTDIETDNGERGQSTADYIYSITVVNQDGTPNMKYGKVTLDGSVLKYEATEQISEDQVEYVYYTVTDKDGGVSETGTITVKIHAISDPPTINACPSTLIDDEWILYEDNKDINGVPTNNSFVINLADPDTKFSDLMFVYELIDADGIVRKADITITSNVEAKTKTITINPLPNMSGKFTFHAEVSDNSNTVDIDIPVTVIPVNDAPVAVDLTGDKAVSTNEETLYSGKLTATDVEDKNTELTYKVDATTVTTDSEGNYVTAKGGVVVVNVDGTFTYMPKENFSGEDSFGFVVTDRGEPVGTSPLSDIGTVTINVINANDDPTAEKFEVHVAENCGVEPSNAATTIDIIGSGYVDDEDLIYGDALYITEATLADGDHGTVTINKDENGNGVSISYLPDLYNNYDVKISYTIADKSGATASAYIDVIVDAKDTAPSDSEGAGIPHPGYPTHPDYDHSGNDVYGDVTKINEDSGIKYYDVLVNDDIDSIGDLNDADGIQKLTLLEVVKVETIGGITPYEATNSITTTGPIAGRIEVGTGANANKLSYKPAENFYGKEIVTYKMQDEAGNIGIFTATFIVSPINDKPTIDVNLTLTDKDKWFTVDEDQDQKQDLIITGFVTDIEDIENGSYILSDKTGLQIAVSKITNKKLIESIEVLEPGVNSDGTFNLKVNLVDDAYGTSTVELTVTDSGKLTNTVTFKIGVISVNDIPKPQPDTLIISENDSATIVDVLKNDDPDLLYEQGDDTLKIVVNSIKLVSKNPDTELTAPTVEFVDKFTYTDTRIDENGNDVKVTGTRNAIIVTPNPNWKSAVPVTYVYSYTVTDTHNTDIDTGKLTITVLPENDEPTITVSNLVGATVDAPETAVIKEDSEWIRIADINVNDEESTVPNLVVTVVDENGKYTYVETTNPIYTPDIKIFEEEHVDGGLEIRPHKNAEDVTDYYELWAKPHPDENGRVTITVTVTDEGNDLVSPSQPKLSASTTVDLIITPEPDAPSNGHDYYVIDEDYIESNFDVTSNDDVDTQTNDEKVKVIGIGTWVDGTGSDITVNDVGPDNKITTVKGGIAYITSDNKIHYEPKQDYFSSSVPVDECPDGCDGDDYFAYYAEDDTGNTAVFRVNIHVNPVNDAPNIVAILYGNSMTPYVSGVSGDITTPEKTANDKLWVVVKDVDNPLTDDGTTVKIDNAKKSSFQIVVRNTGIEVMPPIKGEGEYAGMMLFQVKVTPNDRYTGLTTLTFIANDHEAKNNLSDAVSVPFRVTYINDPPVAVPETYTFTEGDEYKDMQLVENDQDPDFSDTANDDTYNEDLTILGEVTATTNAHVGKFVVSADKKSVTFIPNDGYEHWNGTITFGYTVVDMSNDTSSTTDTLVINPKNDAPVAWNGYVGVVEENNSDTPQATSVSVNIMNHNYDIDIDYTSVLGENDGEATLTDTYGFIKADTTWPDVATEHSLNAADGYVDTMTIVPGSFSGMYSTTVNGVTYKSEVVFDETTNTLTYYPAPYFNGVDVVAFTLKDSAGATSTGTVTFIVTAVKSNPLASTADNYTLFEDLEVKPGDSDFANKTGYKDTYVVTEDGAVFDVINNDVDIDANTSATNANPYGNCNNYWDPALGTDSSNYAESVHEIVKTAIANNPIDAPNTVTLEIVAASDSASGLAKAQYGTVTVDKDSNKIIYVPFDNYIGTDSFEYMIKTEDGLTRIETVNLVVVSRNDAPTAADYECSAVDETDEALSIGINLYDLSLIHDVDVDSVDKDGKTYPDYNTKDASDKLTLAIVSHTGKTGAMVNYTGTAEWDSWVSLDQDGKLVFTPEANYNGTFKVTYKVTDASGKTATATVTFEVNPTEDVPEAVADKITVNEDLTPAHDVVTGEAPYEIKDDGDGKYILIEVLANDKDIDSDKVLNQAPGEVHAGVTALKVTITTPEGDIVGTAEVVTVGGQDYIKYTPVANYNGVVTFEYIVKNTNTTANTSKAVTVTIDIKAQEDVPVTADDSYTIYEDLDTTESSVNCTIETDSEGNSYAKFDVLANDEDKDSEDAVNKNEIKNRTDLVIEIVEEPTHGKVVVVPAVAATADTTGAVAYVKYVPDENYNGTDSFTYVIKRVGSTLTSNESTVKINVYEVKDTPVANNDTYTINEDLSSTPAGTAGVVENGHAVFNVVLNDRDIDANYGNTYDAPTWSHNQDDRDGHKANNLSEFKVAGLGEVTFTDDGAILGTPSLTEYKTANGTFTISEDGQNIYYVPNDNFNGTDYCAYTVKNEDGNTAVAYVKVTVTSVNDAPSAADYECSAVDETDEALSIGINLYDLSLIHDVDVDSVDKDGKTYPDYNTKDASDKLTLAIVSHTGKTGAMVNYTGTAEWDSWVSLDQDGKLVFTPEANYNGTFKVTYKVTDASGKTATATLTFVVNPTDDKPEAVADELTVNEDLTPETTGDNYTIESGYVLIDVLKNDKDIDSDDALNQGGQKHDGVDALVVTNVSDATVGKAEAAEVNGKWYIKYTPADNYNGEVTFTYTVENTNAEPNKVSDAATVKITIVDQDDKPEAVADALTVNEDLTPATTGDNYVIESGYVLIDVLKNDKDIDSRTDLNEGGAIHSGVDALVVTLATQPANGSAEVVTVDGKMYIKYTPVEHYNGVVSFTYTVKNTNGDGNNVSAPATVTITINPQDDKPEAVADELTVNEDLTPATTGDNYVIESGSVLIDVLKNDKDIDSDDALNQGGAKHDGVDALKVTVVTDPAVGTAEVVTVNGKDFIKYTPAEHYNGVVSFTYTVENTNDEPNKVSEPATVTITIDPQEDKPEPKNDTYVFYEDLLVPVPSATDVSKVYSYTYNPTGQSFVLLDVLDNDVDVDSDATLNANPDNRDSLKITDVTTATKGGTAVAVQDTTGKWYIKYYPLTDFNGIETLTYKVVNTNSDGNNTSEEATVTIHIYEVQDDPVASPDVYVINEDKELPLPTNANCTIEDGHVVLNVVVNDRDIDANYPAGTFDAPNWNYNEDDRDDHKPHVQPALKVTALGSVTIDGQGNPVYGTVDLTTYSTGNGTFTISGDGQSIFYVPNDNFIGTDYCAYQVTNEDGRTTTSYLRVTVNSVNDAPTAADYNYPAVDETDAELNIAINLYDLDLIHDVDIDSVDKDGKTYPDYNTVDTNDKLTLSIVSHTGGADWDSWVSLDQDGKLVFTPEANYNGTFKVTYKVTDASNESDTGVVTFVVNATNDPVKAVDDEYKVNEDLKTPNPDSSCTIETDGTDTYAKLEVLTSDEDIDSDTVLNANPTKRTDLVITITVDPEHGTATVIPATADTEAYIKYVPDKDYNGTDVIKYTVMRDGGIDSNEATVTITVVPVNDPPVAKDDTFTLDINVDADPNVEFVIANGYVAANLDVLVNDNDDIDSDVDLNLGGEINDGSLTIVDIYVTAPGATQATTDVRTEHGSASVVNGKIQYIPDDGYIGTDTFYYTMANEDGETATAKVVVTVKSINNAPVITDSKFVWDEKKDMNPSDGHLADYVADSDLSITTITERLLFTLLRVEVDGVEVGDKYGVVTIDPKTGDITFKPSSIYFNGELVVYYSVTDRVDDNYNPTPISIVNNKGVCTLVVNPIMDPPDANEDTYEVNEDLIDPNAPERGVPAPVEVDEDDNAYAVFDVLVNDNDNKDSSADWNLNLSAKNDGTLVIVDLLATATTTNRPAGEDRETTDVKTAHGTVSIVDNKITYVPDPNYNGPDEFSYTIENMDHNASTTIVHIYVNPVNDDPTAVDDAVTTDEDNSITIDVVDNDSDIDSDTELNKDPAINDGTLTVVEVSEPAHGTAVIVGNEIEYTPDNDFNGTDSFTYTVENSDGRRSIATVTVTVTPVNDDPVANPDEGKTLQDYPIVIKPLDNDTDVDCDPELNANPDSLTLSIDPDGFSGNEPGSKITVDPVTGEVTYTPAPGFVGIDEFTYTITDGKGGTTTGKITITVIDSDYTIIIDPVETDYGKVNADYTDAPDSVAFTITNIGNKPVTPKLEALKDYDVTGTIPATLAPGESFTIVVTPKTSLAVGNHDVELKVTTAEGSEVSANLKFEVLNRYIIEATVNDGGTINHDTVTTVEGGTNVTYIFTPNDGYVVADVIVDGQSIGPVNSYEFKNISASHKIEVIWEVAPSSTTSTGETKSSNPIRGITCIALGAMCILLSGASRKLRREEEEEN